MIPVVGSIVSIKMLAIAGALASVASIGSYFIGHSNGVDDDKKRSDLVILQLQVDAAKDLADANKLIKSQSDTMQDIKDKAQQDLQIEKSRNNRRLADATATSNLVRDQIAGFASGASAAQDSLTTCRSDASALGSVLATALQAHGICSGNSETEASNARSLLSAWPRTTIQN
jgi:uncharacterized phage infection (PIP) family protein YhgE